MFIYVQHKYGEPGGFIQFEKPLEAQAKAGAVHIGVYDGSSDDGGDGGEEEKGELKSSDKILLPELVEQRKVIFLKQFCWFSMMPERHSYFTFRQFALSFLLLQKQLKRENIFSNDIHKFWSRIFKRIW